MSQMFFQSDTDLCRDILFQIVPYFRHEIGARDQAVTPFVPGLLWEELK
jgi:hypothetical protein